MISNSDQTLNDGLLRIAGHIEEIDMIRDKIKHDLAEIRPLIIGLKVARFRKIWKIVQADVRNGGQIHVYGVTVRRQNKKDKIGTRGFDLGHLHDCEILGRID